MITHTLNLDTEIPESAETSAVDTPPSSSVTCSRPTSASDIDLLVDGEDDNILEQTAIYKQLMKMGKDI